MTKLGDVAHYVNERINTQSLNPTEYISTDNMMPNKGGLEASSSLPEATSVTRFKTGDVLISNIRPYFKKIWYATTTSGCSNDVLVFRTNDSTKYASLFLYYVLSQDSFFDYMMAGANGTKMPRGNKKAILDFEVPSIQYNKQLKIAQILSIYDCLIDNSKKQIKLLEEAAQRIYKEWFVDLRFPGHEHTKIVDGIPEGWEKKTLSEICTLISAGGTPGRNITKYWNPKSIRWYKTGELKDCWLINAEEFISAEGLENSSAKLFPANSILMAIYASPTIGRLGILASDSACNQASLCLIADEKFISWQWLYMKLFELRNDFNAIAKGAGQQNISADIVKNKEIFVPEKSLIYAFTNIMKVLFDKQLLLQKEILILKEARDRLLPKLMNGEIEV